MVVHAFKHSQMDVEQVPVQHLLCGRRVKARERNELDEFWLLGFVMWEQKLTADVVIEHVVDVWAYFVVFIHEDRALDVRGPGFNFLNHLHVLFLVGQVQLVHNRVVDRMEDLLQVPLGGPLVVGSQSKIYRVLGHLLFALRQQLSDRDHLWQHLLVECVLEVLKQFQ